MKAKTITTLVKEIDTWAEEKGWKKPELARQTAVTPKVTSEPVGVKVHLVLAKLALVIEEVGEAVTEARHGRWGIYTVERLILPDRAIYHPWAKNDDASRYKPEGFVVELADIMIRIMQLAGALGLPLEEAIHLKMKYNQTRPYRHGKKA